MDKQVLQDKWKLAGNGGTAFRSLRIDSECKPELYIGLQDAVTRSLILRLPPSFKIDFRSSGRTNLSMDYYPDTNWIVLKLLDETFIDLFDDLILSIYFRISGLEDPDIYTKELISTYFKWSEFFIDKTSSRCSEEMIRGLFGELIYIREIISVSSSADVNDILNGWQGPYNNRHDFSIGQTDIEVKTKIDKSSDVVISSEFQLTNQAGRGLQLTIVTLRREENALSLRDLALSIRDITVRKLGDFTIILKGLAGYGLDLRGLLEYQDLRFQPLHLETYDCLIRDFPRITTSLIPAAISGVSYSLRISEIKDFQIHSKVF